MASDLVSRATLNPNSANGLIFHSIFYSGILGKLIPLLVEWDAMTKLYISALHIFKMQLGTLGYSFNTSAEIFLSFANKLN